MNNKSNSTTIDLCSKLLLVIIIVIYKILLTWCKIGNREIHYDMCM